MKAGFNAIGGLAVVDTGETFDFVWLRSGVVEYERGVDQRTATRHIRMTNSHNRLVTDDLEYDTLEDVGAALQTMSLQENALYSVITILDPTLDADLRREMADIVTSRWSPELDACLRERMYGFPAPPSAAFDVADVLTGPLAVFYQGLPRR